MGIADYAVMVLGILISALTVMEKWEKIKWKPFTWLFGSGRCEIENQIKNITKELKLINESLLEINTREYEHYKKQAKMFISDFAADLRKTPKKDYLKVKSKSQFCSIIDLCDEYLDKKWNSEVKHDADFIKDVFNSLKDVL